MEPGTVGLGSVIYIGAQVIKVLKAYAAKLERWKKGLLEPADLFFLGDEIGVVIGNGNLHELQRDPDAGPSRYISSTAGNLLHAAGALRPKLEYVDADELSKKKNIAGVLLGGPVANEAYRHYCGYTLIKPDDGGAMMPRWAPNGLRWGFFLGINSWGLTPANRKLGTDSPLEELKAFRWLPDGKLTEKPEPTYGIIDEYGAISVLPVDNQGRLGQDYALVTRLERRDAPGRYLTMIAGAHGYATEAFGRDWRNHTAFLRAVAKKHGNEFQVLIPANINYSLGIEGVSLDLNQALTTAVRRK